MILPKTGSNMDGGCKPRTENGQDLILDWPCRLIEVNKVQ